MPEYAFDPDFHAVVPLLPGVQDELADPAQVAAARERLDQLIPAVPQREDVVREDRGVPGREGDPEVPVRLYRPRAERGADAGARPAVFEIHGGGFLMGSLKMMDAWCDTVAAELDAVVVSVDYRLAPEHPFPAGVEDCYAALSWLAAHAAELGVDSARMAIAGQSAGGGLAAATSLLARDRGGPALCFQLLEIPELDHRLATPSMKAFTDTPLWNHPNAVWSWKHYLGPDHVGEVSPYASPSVAKDLSGLPPAYVSTMEFDPLRDEGIEYALRLMQAGVSVELHTFPGTFHGSSLVPAADASRRNNQEVLHVLRRRLGAAAPGD
jgi:acetyl esterase/lipase